MAPETELRIWLTKFVFIGAAVLTAASIGAVFVTDNAAVQASLTALMSMFSAAAGAAVNYWFHDKNSSDEGHTDRDSG